MQAEEQERMIELEAMRLAQLQLASRPISRQSCLGYSMNELKLPEGPSFYPILLN